MEARVEALLGAGENIDYVTFVPDGEPTLDEDLRRTIELIRPLGIKIAIISNGSLIWRREVQETLKLADWISLKVDSVDEHIWRHIKRPYADLELQNILAGMLEFASKYAGVLTSETMLVDSVNVSDGTVLEVAEFLHKLKPHTAYLSIPTRSLKEAFVLLMKSS